MIDRVQLKEQQSYALNDACASQAESMMELMGDDSPFTLAHSPRGENFSVEGSIGQVLFRDGTQINIVPTIPSVRSDDGSSKMLMEMLYSVFGMTTKGSMADDLFEFFVRVFIDSISKLVNKGLRSKYHLVSGNEKAFKGRIVFNEHIRQNYIHKERIFVEYEFYSQNRPENRLIKTTLEALSRKTTDSHNIKGLKTLIMSMEEIPSSTDVDKDLGMVIMDRNMVDYESPLLWCNIFLKGMGLAGASKDNLSYALLVRTHDLYSSYVAKMSTVERTDGTFQVRYGADIRNDGDSKGVSVIMIDLNWSFYDRQKDVTVLDPEALFMSAPGYRVIPHAGGNRLRSMAGSYLSDVLV